MSTLFCMSIHTCTAAPIFFALTIAHPLRTRQLSDMHLTSLSVFGTFTAIVQSARFSVSVQPSQQLPNPATLPPSTHAVLLGPPGTRYDVPIRRDNSFVFPDIAEASYLLTIHSRDHHFPPLRLDVAKAEDDISQDTLTAWQTFRGNEWSNKGPTYGTGRGGLEVQIRSGAQKDFYQARDGFSLIAFVKSPMILMALFSVVMIFFLPKMLENSKCLCDGVRCEMEPS